MNGLINTLQISEAHPWVCVGYVEACFASLSSSTPFSCSAFWMSWTKHLFSATSFCLGVSVLEPADYWLKPWAKLNLSTFKLQMSGIVSSDKKVTSTHILLAILCCVRCFLKIWNFVLKENASIPYTLKMDLTLTQIANFLCENKISCATINKNCF